MKKLPTLTVQLSLNDDWHEKGSGGREMEKKQQKKTKQAKL